MITIVAPDSRYRLDLLPKEEGFTLVMLTLSTGRRLSVITDRPLHVALEHAEAMLRPLFEPWPRQLKGPP